MDKDQILKEALQACLDAMLHGVGETLPIKIGTLREEWDWVEAIKKAREALSKKS